MFKRLIPLIALLGAPGFALAADLPSHQAPLPVFVPPPIFTWTGVYIGGQIGYGWGNDRMSVPAFFAAPTTSPEGVVGGAHIGYNYQVNQFVLGVEGDVDGTSISKNIFDPVTGTTFGTRIPVEGSVRGRLGVAWDRALFYATGGAAFADLQKSYTVGSFPFFGAAAPFYAQNSQSRVGWTVGGGVEYAITNNWSVRGEYRYTDFGHQTDALPAVAASVDHHEIEHAVRVGFSYKFEMYAPPPPVVAKY
jgi:outer membrane immunogenic protein